MPCASFKVCLRAPAVSCFAFFLATVFGLAGCGDPATSVPEPDAGDFERPDAGSVDASTRMMDIDAGTDAGVALGENRDLALRFVGTGRADVDFVVRDSVRRTCGEDCTVPLGSDRFEVSLRARNTYGGTVFDGFSCPGASGIECGSPRPSATEVEARIRDTGAPDGNLATFPGPESDTVFDVAVGPLGAVYSAMYVRRMRILGGEVTGTILLTLNSNLSVNNYRVLSAAYQPTKVAVDPSGDTVWTAGRCGAGEDFLGETRRSAGLCVARTLSNGLPLDSASWDGDASVDEMTIGQNGTVAFTGRMFETVSWRGVPDSPGRPGGQYVATLQRPLGVGVIAFTGGDDIETPKRVAVGPSGEIYVSGAVRGRRTIGPLDFDLPPYVVWSYILQYDEMGTVVRGRRFASAPPSAGEGGGTVIINALTADESGVYVGGEFDGRLDAGNTTSRVAPLLNPRAFLASYSGFLDYRFHVHGELSTKIVDVASRPGGGVYLSMFSHGAPLSIEGDGFVASVSTVSAVAALDSRGALSWIRRLGPAGAFVVSAPAGALAAGTFLGRLDFEEAPTTAGPSDVFFALLPE